MSEDIQATKAPEVEPAKATKAKGKRANVLSRPARFTFKQLSITLSSASATRKAKFSPLHQLELTASAVPRKAPPMLRKLLQKKLPKSLSAITA